MEFLWRWTEILLKPGGKAKRFGWYVDDSAVFRLFASHISNNASSNTLITIIIAIWVKILIQQNIKHHISEWDAYSPLINNIINIIGDIIKNTMDIIIIYQKNIQKTKKIQIKMAELILNLKRINCKSKYLFLAFVIKIAWFCFFKSNNQFN